MVREILLTACIIVAVNLTVKSQTYKVTDIGVKLTVDSIDVEIQFYSPSIARILKSPHGTFFKKESLSVIKGPLKKIFAAKQERDLVKLRSDSLQINVDLKLGNVSFYNLAGEVLLEEKPNGGKFIPFDDSGTNTFNVSQVFVLGQNEMIYGLGQRQNGKMVQRNQTINLVQDNTEDAIPFFQSVKGYGVFWDNYSRTTFSDSPEETALKSEVGDCIDYYFMYAGNANGVVARMRELTGQVPMFPLWTYGFWQSKERYKSQDETVGVVEKYRTLGVPLDGIIQDWQYWGSNYLWNAMEFLNPEFYNARKMVDDVHRNNAHIIISIWSSFGQHTKQYRELEKENMLFDFATWPQSGSEKWPPNMDYPSGVRVYDAFHPKARDIYWKHLDNGLLTLEMDGWWMDSTEPDHLQVKPSDFDNKTYLGSYRKVCNAYPLMTVGGVYTHQRSSYSDKRIFILTRSAFAGQQRYASNTWSGDVVASWKTLKKQIPAGLNFSLCGIPYWNSDIGGFFLWEFPKKLNDPEYRELYVRWLEFGTFCPMMRSHGTDAPREIYQFGKKGDKAYDAIEKFINLRYRFLPYIYSTSWDVTANQSSMMRALMMDFANDKNVLDINDQYMFGRSLMVSPVTAPMYVKQSINGKDTVNVEDFTAIKVEEVYLPAGFYWYDFWTGEKLLGGETVKKETPLDIIPLYVKAGSIIPFGPTVQYASEKNWDNLEIRVYEGANGKFVLYEDENDNYNYEKGAYSTIAFTWDDAKKTMTIGDRMGSFNGVLSRRTFNIIRVSANHMGRGEANVIEKYDRVITYNGKKAVIRF